MIHYLPGVIRVIRFGCSIHLPTEGKFLFLNDFQNNPEEFLKNWLEGAISNIYTGPQTNRYDDHDGHLLVAPSVAVEYHHHLPTPEVEKPRHGQTAHSCKHL